ncbi:MAG: hypothetical protein EOM23_12350 [Candidatus Moranbacteria bacterium]|nr:hypothetical protein [Candidatus Moranbacteria bacterium]
MKKCLMRRYVTAFFILIHICANYSFAQSTLEVEGIMFGEVPVAVVNGKVVKVGDEIDTAEVMEIGEDFVKFSLDQGGYYISRLVERSYKGNSINEKSQRVSNDTNNSSRQELRSKTFENIENYIDYIEEAKDELRKQRVPTVKSYQKAMSLFDKAERELQYGLERVLMDSEGRDKIKPLISRVREYKDTIYQEKRNLKKQIEDAIRNNKLVEGMTKSDVTRSWGRAHEVNRSNYGGVRQEQWIYEDEKNRRDAYLYFDEDILTSIQYR